MKTEEIGIGQVFEELRQIRAMIDKLTEGMARLSVHDTKIKRLESDVIEIKTDVRNCVSIIGEVRQVCSTRGEVWAKGKEFLDKHGHRFQAEELCMSEGGNNRGEVPSWWYKFVYGFLTNGIWTVVTTAITIFVAIAITKAMN